MADSTNLIDIAVANNVDPQIAPRLLSIADASDKADKSVGSLKSQLASLQSSGFGSLASQLQNVRGTIAQTTTATNGLVSANVSAAASLGILEGRTLSMNRAAANFATRVLGLGPILQAAFPIIGAVAMIDVLYQMGSSLTKVYEKAKNAGREIAKGFEEATTSVRRSNDQLALANDKLDATIAKLEHKPTTNGALMALDEARVMADRLDESLDDVGKRLDSVLAKNAISVFGGLITGQKSTSEASKQIKERYEVLTQEGELSAQKRLEDAGTKVYASMALRQKAINDALAEGMKDRSSAVEKFRDEMQRGQNQDSVLTMNQAGEKTKVPGAGLKAEWEEYGGAIKLAKEELRSFDLTIGNMTKTAAVDRLHDQTSGLRVETKEAAKQWKELEAAFVQFQTAMDKAGHKPTAQQDLAFLVGKEATINPLNRDKLAAKELPYQNKIAGENFDANETAKLSDQVSQIGLYSDAMKEAVTLNHILEAARKANVTLTTEEIANYKGLIATIVENKEYDKELESVYKSINEPTELYRASVHALTTQYSEGNLSQAQYNQGIKETSKQYKEATNAAAFENKLAQQRKNQASMVGSNRNLSVQSELNSYGDELRKTKDAAHPTGWSTEQIETELAAKRSEIATMQQEDEQRKASNSLVYAQTNLYNDLIVKENALTAAVKAGTMSQQAANAERLKDYVQQNNQQLKSGTGGNPFKGALAEYAKDFDGFSAGIKDTFAGVAKTLGDGFANSIGRWVTGTEKLGKALKDVARSAISELISSLIKLSIQYLVVSKLAKALHIKPVPTVAGPSPKQAAEGVAGMAAITVSGLIMTRLLTEPMWSLAEAMAGVTFGASAIAGATSIAALAAAGSAAQNSSGSVPSLSVGTNLLPSDMFIFAHQGERVIPAADNREIITALQGGSVGSGRGKMHVEIHNNGNGHVETQEVSDDHIRLIIHAETPNLISKHAPGIIAGDIGNPNSKTSKAISRSTSATRRR